ncbi:MAG: hypothetical protein J6584_00355 [Lactobacillus sp.]|uniref:hypothetical protein n=1 Tax=Bombilactobacillus bombi TaxID=1303590 RepID=UPI000E58D2C1|nr:hypothetical protein [Bombilactobacillus bombi]AXX65456.1 hypothetical protein DS830_08125 [Bombilactobacillus bombi]MCO6542418.1 hypothetical protein [Lactobacillus sp.]
MEQLQRYHPIFTENYQWEFLSNLTGKALQEFLKTDIPTSARYANQAMQQIMANKGLIWGVIPKQKTNLIGIIELQNITNKSLLLNLNFQQSVPQEILIRLRYFIKQQLNIQKVYFNPDAKNQQEWQDFFA